MRLDYRAIRNRISIVDVLELIGYSPSSVRGNQTRGQCPICSAEAAQASRCFSADHRRNLFHCFRCRAAGNSLDLWMQLTGQPIRQATLDLCQRLAIEPLYLYLKNPQPPTRR